MGNKSSAVAHLISGPENWNPAEEEQRLHSVGVKAITRKPSKAQSLNFIKPKNLLKEAKNRMSRRSGGSSYSLASSTATEPPLHPQRISTKNCLSSRAEAVQERLPKVVEVDSCAINSLKLLEPVKQVWQESCAPSNVQAANDKADHKNCKVTEEKFGTMLSLGRASFRNAVYVNNVNDLSCQKQAELEKINMSLVTKSDHTTNTTICRHLSEPPSAVPLRHQISDVIQYSKMGTCSELAAKFSKNASNICSAKKENSLPHPVTKEVRLGGQYSTTGNCPAALQAQRCTENCRTNFISENCSSVGEKDVVEENDVTNAVLNDMNTKNSTVSTKKCRRCIKNQKMSAKWNGHLQNMICSANTEANYSTCLYGNILMHYNSACNEDRCYCSNSKMHKDILANDKFKKPFKVQYPKNASLHSYSQSSPINDCRTNHPSRNKCFSQSQNEHIEGCVRNSRLCGPSGSTTSKRLCNHMSSSCRMDFQEIEIGLDAKSKKHSNHRKNKQKKRRQRSLEHPTHIRYHYLLSPTERCLDVFASSDINFGTEIKVKDNVKSNGTKDSTVSKDKGLPDTDASCKESENRTPVNRVQKFVFADRKFATFSDQNVSHYIVDTKRHRRESRLRSRKNKKWNKVRPKDISRNKIPYVQSDKHAQRCHYSTRRVKKSFRKSAFAQYKRLLKDGSLNTQDGAAMGGRLGGPSAPWARQEPSRSSLVPNSARIPASSPRSSTQQRWSNSSQDGTSVSSTESSQARKPAQSREELFLVREAIGALRTNFRNTDPNQHILDTLEQAISIIMEKNGSNTWSSHGVKTTETDDTSKNIRSTDHTKVIYFTERTVTPFMSTIPKPIGDITLRDFKVMFDRPGNHRYHFKNFDPEYGMVKEEIVKDEDVLPGVDGKIIAWVQEDHE